MKNEIERDNLVIWSVENVLEDAEALDLEKEFYEREEVDELLEVIGKKLEKALDAIYNISGISDIDDCRKALEEIDTIIV